MTPGAQALVLAALVPVYYGMVVRVVGEPLAGRVLTAVVARSPVARRWSIADLDGVSRLLLAGVMQALFLAAVVAALPVSAADLVPDRIDASLLLLGVALGVAEAGLGAHLAYLGSRVAERVRPDQTPQTVEGWLDAARGGWVRYYLRTASVAPRWFLVAATSLYVAGEEVLFRGVVLTGLADAPAVAAVGLSTALFVVAQVFYTPGWQTALFPVVGAVVVGVVHGVLFWLVPDLTPLIVAHATMFLFTVL